MTIRPIDPDEPVTINGVQVTGRQLAEARQELSHRGVLNPRWIELSQHDQEVAALSAGGWLRAINDLAAVGASDAAQQRPGEDDLGPSPAQLGDTMTVAPSEWTPLDDLGTQLYLYGDRPADIAVQTAQVDDEVRRLRDEVERLRTRIGEAYEALAIEEFDGDSCPDLESTIEYAIGRYRAVCRSEADAADRIQELRIQLDQIAQRSAS